MTDNIRVDCRCPFCGKINHVTLTESQWHRWNFGELIQNVAPELSPAERELLISGICNECWNKTFGGN